MAARNITGIALEGHGAAWVVLDAASGAVDDAMSGGCVFEFSVSEVISDGGEKTVSAGAKIKESLEGVKGDVAVSLPSDQALLRILDLPTTDPDEIASMVELQIDKVSPFPVEGMVVAHEVIARKEGGVVAAGLAVRRELVHNTSELLNAAGIVPTRVDVNALVWWRMIKGSGTVAEQGKQVFILFRGETSEFVVVSDGVPVLFRAFVRQAEQTDPEFMDEVCEELGYTLMSLELEHGAFTDFSISIWHSGMLADDLLAKPKELCADNLEIKSLETMPDLAEGVASRCIEEGAIDLTPGDLIQERTRRAFRMKLVKSLAGVGAVWLFSLAVLFGGLALQKVRLKTVKADIERIKGDAIAVRELRRKVRTISLYTDRSRSALECLREVSIKQPAGVDLTVLSYRKGESLNLSGEAPNVNQVYDFKKNMDTSKLFESVSLDGPKRIRGKEVFEIDAKLPGGGE